MMTAAMKLKDSCLENPMDRGAWGATVHGVHKESDTTEQLTHLIDLQEDYHHVLQAWPSDLIQRFNLHNRKVH